MLRLRMTEKNLIDELTGMRSGYVLNFSNATFAEFFRTEVGIDIYDDAYDFGSGSKGKRLQAFLEFVRGLHDGLQSLLIMRRIEASLRKASALALRHSQSLARRRQRPSHAKVRSTIQRFGSTTKPLA